jgi:uncharacterized membrane protein YhaH (DUF805 family)
MSAVNPYQPPRAHIEDIQADSGVQPVRLFSSQGRIGRLRYIAYGTGAYLLLGLAIGVLSVIAKSSSTLGGVLMVLALIPYIVFFVMISIQRSHDMGWSGWTTPLIFVPLVGLIWIFNGGTKGANRFGAPPPPNTWGVRILGLVMPVIAIIGILAAIALPAYSDYTKRAQAARIQPAR